MGLSVCAVVVTCNRKELLLQALAALQAQQRRPDAILVVDNASTDGTAEIVQQEFPSAEVLRLQKNVGGAGGFHIGMKVAAERRYDWLWLMDDDTIPETGALHELLRALERFEDEPRPVVLASKVIWSDGLLHTMNPSYVKSGDLEALYRSAARATLSIRSTTFVSCLLHRTAIERYGLPNAGYFIWGDDTEYTARILRSEFGVVVPASIALHKTAKKHTALDATPERYAIHVRNTVWMLLRSPAWERKEKLRQGAGLARWSSRYVFGGTNRRERAAAVLQGLWRGFTSHPAELDVGAITAPAAGERG
jgi:rhamnopyranosyl-N-acetylglucosaminyl-diphospho-decaprenol beta-1,3/1,4-galactofuranosyltransferase